MKNTNTLLLLEKLEKMEDPKQFRGALQGIFTEVQSSVGELIQLAPESLRGQLTQLKAKTDQFLAGLATTPTDQVPAAQEASWALRQMAYACATMQETYNSVVGLMNDLTKRYTPMSAELQGLKEQQEKGELVPATKLSAAVTEAIEKTQKEERERATRLQSRRSELQSLKLPVPEDGVIDGADDAFKTVKGNAETRLKSLNEIGASKELNASELCSLVYGSQAEFDRTVKMAKRLSGRGAEAQELEPLAGGGGGEGGSGGGEGEGKQGRRMRAF